MSLKFGSEFVHFDDHVRKRLYDTLDQKMKPEEIQENNLFKNLRDFLIRRLLFGNRQICRRNN